MAAAHNSWLLLLAYLGAAASSATHSSGQPRARLVSDAVPDGRLHKRTGHPCFVGTLLPKTRTVLDNWSTSRYTIRRTAPLSLLATATSPAGGAEREVESDGRRTCFVFSPGETVSYEKALGWQQKLQRERIDHKVSSRGKVSRAPGPRTHAAQWAPSSRSQDHTAWQADAVSLPDALILLEHPTARTPLFSLLQLLSKLHHLLAAICCRRAPCHSAPRPSSTSQHLVQLSTGVHARIVLGDVRYPLPFAHRATLAGRSPHLHETLGAPPPACPPSSLDRAPRLRSSLRCLRRR
jgi:hypothetical protein